MRTEDTWTFNTFSFFLVTIHLRTTSLFHEIDGKEFSMFHEIRSAFSRLKGNKTGFYDITKYGYEQYQDIIINNTVVKKASGNHETDVRYRIIQTVLDQYRRPFEMLDIGASQGYYSFRAAHDYDCVCVMIEGDNPAYPKVGKQLRDLCEANDSLRNIILLNKPVMLDDLQKLSECESFSVVLALNIIHWLGSRWKEATDAILSLGDNIIIETPPQESHANSEQNALRESIEDYLLSKKAKILGEVPRHTSENKMAAIYLIETEKKKLLRKHWIAPVNDDHYSIESNYEKRTITKRPPHALGLQVNNWEPGINLMTFLMYHGTYPSRKKIVTAIKSLQDFSHNDWTVNNMILQGDKLTLIDWNDPAHGSDGGRRSTAKVMKVHSHLVGLKDPGDIENYFWNRLVRT
jgi:hypothetical protein